MAAEAARHAGQRRMPVRDPVAGPVIVGGCIEVQRLPRNRALRAGGARGGHAPGDAVERMLRRRAPEARQPRRRHRIVVHDGADGHTVGDDRAFRIVQLDLEGLRALVVAVVEDADPEPLLGLPRSEAESPLGPQVVLALPRRHRVRLPGAVGHRD
ncbi:MAG: hypothetical protein OXG62_01185, partial [Nitrospinae bacterium]|nr:hypothetical protein [Nitrospinota bacterium]